MKERPILFSAPMVRALLDGSKTQTRRIVKPQPSEALGWSVAMDCWRPVHRAPPSQAWKCPYGQPGDCLWVRETFLPDPSCDDDAWDGHTDTYHSWSGCGGKISCVPPALRNPDNCIYKAGWVGSALVWRPSIHMPRWASRILLEIVSVRVERLNDINEVDTQAEGCSCYVCGGTLDGRSEADCHCFHRTAKATDYRHLWESINGPGSWDANPWVWVVEFKRLMP